MLQIKIIPEDNLARLNDSVNTFLSDLTSDAVRDIDIDADRIIAVIQYEMAEAWKKMLCADCQHWDDGQSADAVMGICQMCGGRKRFNNKACSKFKDVRD